MEAKRTEINRQRQKHFIESAFDSKEAGRFIPLVSVQRRDKTESRVPLSEMSDKYSQTSSGALGGKPKRPSGPTRQKQQAHYQRKVREDVVQHNFSEGTKKHTGFSSEKPVHQQKRSYERYCWEPTLDEDFQFHTSSSRSFHEDPRVSGRGNPLVFSNSASTFFQSSHTAKPAREPVDRETWFSGPRKNTTSYRTKNGFGYQILDFIIPPVSAGEFHPSQRYTRQQLPFSKGPHRNHKESRRTARDLMSDREKLGFKSPNIFAGEEGPSGVSGVFAGRFIWELGKSVVDDIAGLTDAANFLDDPGIEAMKQREERSTAEVVSGLFFSAKTSVGTWGETFNRNAILAGKYMLQGREFEAGNAMFDAVKEPIDAAFILGRGIDLTAGFARGIRVTFTRGGSGLSGHNSLPSHHSMLTEFPPVKNLGKFTPHTTINLSEKLGKLESELTRFHFERFSARTSKESVRGITFLPSYRTNFLGLSDRYQVMQSATIDNFVVKNFSQLPDKY